jgi:protein phosphatase 1 regulatory subunit 37
VTSTNLYGAELSIGTTHIDISQVLKPILHSLLLPGSLSFLSIASNRRLKTPAFRLLGAYLKKAGHLVPLSSLSLILDS